MSAQPVHYDDPHDPQVILRTLPERARAAFLAEYGAAVDAARNPSGYPALRTLLREWSTRAVSYSTPGFFEAAQDALTGRGTYTSLEDLAALRRAG